MKTRKLNLILEICFLSTHYETAYLKSTLKTIRFKIFINTLDKPIRNQLNNESETLNKYIYYIYPGGLNQFKTRDTARNK